MSRKSKSFFFDFDVMSVVVDVLTSIIDDVLTSITNDELISVIDNVLISTIDDVMNFVDVVLAAVVVLRFFD